MKGYTVGQRYNEHYLKLLFLFFCGRQSVCLSHKNGSLYSIQCSSHPCATVTIADERINNRINVMNMIFFFFLETTQKQWWDELSFFLFCHITKWKNE